MKIEKALELLKEVMIEEGLDDWSVGVGKARTQYGTCYNKKRKIILSEVIIPRISDEEVMDTIYHEVAHALNPREHHGNNWRKDYLRMGGTGERCATASKELKDYLLETKKWIARCPVCGNENRYDRRRNYSCGICEPNKYNEKYKLVWIENKNKKK